MSWYINALLSSLLPDEPFKQLAAEMCRPFHPAHDYRTVHEPHVPAGE